LEFNPVAILKLKTDKNGKTVPVRHRNLTSRRLQMQIVTTAVC